jgi:asparagine synthase (glutamine-hydrolysing)
LHTFSAVSKEERNCLETQFIKMVIGQGNVAAHAVQPDQLDTLHAAMSRVLHETPDPFDTQMSVPHVMYIMARNQGINVLLDGVDGDLVASLGTKYLAYLLRSGRWKTAIVEAIGASYFYKRYYSPMKLLYLNGRTAFAPNWLRQLRFRLRRDLAGKTNGNTIINIDFARQINLMERLRKLHSYGRPTLLATLREHHSKVLNHPYIVVALERYDRVAAAYSVEPRHPFFDKRVVELSLALPWWQKRYNGWSKVVLRRAMAKPLPEAVLWRRGSDHLGPKFTSKWLSLEQKLLGEIIGGSLCDAAEYINLEAVHEAYGRYFSGERLESDEYLLWQAFTFVLWLRRSSLLPISRSYQASVALPMSNAILRAH